MLHSIVISSYGNQTEMKNYVKYYIKNSSYSNVSGICYYSWNITQYFSFYVFSLERGSDAFFRIIYFIYGGTIICGCDVYLNATSTHFSSCQSGLVPSKNYENCVASIVGCLLYEVDGNCTQCVAGKIPSSDYLSCINNLIENCATYSTYSAENITCKKCNNGFMPSNTGHICVLTIRNCISYTDEKLCETCVLGSVLSETNKTCVVFIDGCMAYLDNATCKKCQSSKLLSQTMLMCLNPIDACEVYNDNGTCKTCKENNTVTETGFLCVSIIQNCSLYSDDTICKKCVVNKTLSESRSFCVDVINSCEAYNDNGTCKAYYKNNASIETEANCVPIIKNCSIYSDETKCKACLENFFQSEGEIHCLNEITNCSIYLDDADCKSFHSEFFISKNNKSCIFYQAACLNNIELESQIKHSIVINSFGIFLLKKNGNSSIEIYNNYNENYSMTPNKQNIIFISFQDNRRENLNISYKTNKNKLIIYPNIENIKSEKYKIEITLLFHLKSRLLSDSSGASFIPDSFLLSYSMATFYVGNETEISKFLYENQENKISIYKNDENSNNYYYTFFALLLLIPIIAAIFYFHFSRKMKIVHKQIMSQTCI